MMIKRVFDWVKANPITLAAAAMAAAALLSLLVLNSAGAAFVTQMQQRANVIAHLASLQQTKVKIPPANPDDPEVRLQLAVNQGAIDQLKNVYEKMNKEYTEIFKLAVDSNRGRHVPMHPGLFPEPRDPAVPFEVRDIYRGILEKMFDRPTAANIYPRLNAGQPPSQMQIAKALAKVQENYLANNFFPPKEKIEQLTDPQLDQLNELKKQKLLELLQEKAQSIHLYADTDIASPDFAFDVGQWSKPGPRPLMSEIWEGQVGLWIQQDIAQAIELTNQPSAAKSNVMSTPVKRLIGVRVIPGGVGVEGFSANIAGSGQINGRRRMAQLDRTQAPPVDTGSIDDRLPDNFEKSPTGRQSNAMYDVWYAKTAMVLDAQAMPAFFENLQRVNLMSVLVMTVQDVDEYEALRDGFVYGSGDAVRVEMLIETIWLREWTSQYMPESVRNQLGVATGG